MAEKFIINTSALIYNAEGKILYVTRGSKEETPNIAGYPGGKSEYNLKDFKVVTKNAVDFLEVNLKRELKEEINIDVKEIEYFHSHCFTNSEGDKVVLVAFLCPFPEDSKIKVDGVDTVDFDWVDKDEMETKDTIDIVKYVYKKGFEEIERRKYHQHIEVAGLVLNDKDEFLMLKEKATGKYIFPHGRVENLPGRTWEVLEKNLIRNIFTQTAIEVAEGIIPFTDKEFIGKDGFEKIIQFFICKYQRGEAVVTDPDQYSEVTWKDINLLKEDDFKPLVYTVYKKAFEFINKINN